jgi:hypothetical protein
MGGITKYATEMGSGAMIYTSSFIKVSSEIQNTGNSQAHRHTDSMEIA